MRVTAQVVAAPVWHREWDALLMRETGSLYVYSFSVALQALTVISTGGIADHRTSFLLNMSYGYPVCSVHLLILLSSCSPTSQTSTVHVRLPWLLLRHSLLLPFFVFPGMASRRSLRHIRKCGLWSVCGGDERVSTNASEEQRGSCDGKTESGGRDDEATQ